MRGRSRLAVAAVGVALLLGAVPVSAERGGMKMTPEDMFTLMDTDHDGKVTRAEFAEFHRKRAELTFANRDKQGKGYLTKEDFMKNAEGAKGPGNRPGPADGGGPKPE